MRHISCLLDFIAFTMLPLRATTELPPRVLLLEVSTRSVDPLSPVRSNISRPTSLPLTSHGYLAASGFPADVSNPVNPSAANSASGTGASNTAAATSTAAAGNAAAQSWNINAMTVLAAGALGLGVVGGAFGVLA